MCAGHSMLCPLRFLGRECVWAQSEDTRKMFTRGVEFAQVVVGVKKNRPRLRGVGA